jgi:hypothetical protein
MLFLVRCGLGNVDDSDALAETGLGWSAQLPFAEKNLGF